MEGQQTLRRADGKKMYLAILKWLVEENNITSLRLQRRILSQGYHYLTLKINEMGNNKVEEPKEETTKEEVVEEPKEETTKEEVVEEPKEETEK